MSSTQLSLSEEAIGGDGEAELVEWYVADGALVGAGQPVAELSTSKAIIELPAPVAGMLKQLVAVGETVLPDQPIGTLS